ncbi:MAG: GNAT family N-acetyltransferase [Candidatus Promineifilaceae bacterium]|nr:GNAT family N-acetyltransferase [Candidatus Promineifilaceae bacterium]
MNEQAESISILPFKMDAYSQVYEMWQRCEGIGLSSADRPQHIATYLDRNPGMSFLASVGGNIVGAILGGHDGRRGYIHHLAVDEAYRRLGIGRKLVERCLAALKAEGIQKCHLFIFHKNNSGIAFWESIGWTLRQDIQVISAHI